jgi:hypothetical protein
VPEFTQQTAEAVDNKTKFHLEEFRQLRAEILMRDRTQIQLGLYSVFAIGIMFSFFVSHIDMIDRLNIRFVWASLPAISISGYLWKIALGLRIRSIGNYIKKLESEYALEGLG